MQALLIGLLWLLRTVLADVVFVYYVLGTSWSALVADYNLGRGRLGALVFVIQAVSPYLLTKRAPCFSWVVTPPQCGPARMEMHNGSESGYHAGIARKGWL